jgi:hypothetical protein
LLVAIIAIGLTGAGWCQNRPPTGPVQVDGKSEYQGARANCCGVDGKGKGPLSTQLTVMPADLTVLAKNNNGVFPLSAVYEVIDGRAENKIVIAHGTRDMPIWGDRYRPGPDAAFYPYAELSVRTRILAVIDYLNSIQAK